MSEQKWVDRLAATYRRGADLAVFFDYDGTLTPIVSHPSLARLAPEMRQRMRSLATLDRVSVGVVSSRVLNELRLLVGLPGLYYAGSTGMEIDLLGHHVFDPEIHVVGGLVERIQDQLMATMRTFPGTWFERKPGALSIHYRDLLPLSAACFRLETIRILSNFPSLRYRAVSQAIEVMPSKGADKGTAVQIILNHMNTIAGSEHIPVYFGDAENDVEAMQVVADRGGIAVGIGEDAPACADVRLFDVDEFALSLVRFLKELGSEGPVTGSVQTLGNAGPSRNILLLDPDPQFRRVLGEGLTRLGWRVLHSGTTEEALRILVEERNAVECAIVDLQFPGFESSRVLKELGQHNPNMLRCYMASDVARHAATAYAEVSDTPLFLKPFSPRALDQSLREILIARTSLTV